MTEHESIFFIRAALVIKPMTFCEEEKTILLACYPSHQVLFATFDQTQKQKCSRNLAPLKD
jgi:hypothetical protein